VSRFLTSVVARELRGSRARYRVKRSSRCSKYCEDTIYTLRLCLNSMERFHSPGIWNVTNGIIVNTDTQIYK